jgi:hypothetical protein
MAAKTIIWNLAGLSLTLAISKRSGDFKLAINLTTLKIVSINLAHLYSSTLRIVLHGKC